MWAPMAVGFVSRPLNSPEQSCETKMDCLIHPCHLLAKEEYVLALGSTLYTQMLLCYIVCQAGLEAEETALQPATYAATFCGL